MIKIKISKAGNDFIEISYNDFGIYYGKSCHVFNKTTVVLLMSIDKTSITITFTGGFIIVGSDTLSFVETTATTVEEFYNELKTFL